MKYRRPRPTDHACSVALNARESVLPSPAGRGWASACALLDVSHFPAPSALRGRGAHPPHSTAALGCGYRWHDALRAVGDLSAAPPHHSVRLGAELHDGLWLDALPHPSRRGCDDWAAPGFRMLFPSRKKHAANFPLSALDLPIVWLRRAVVGLRSVDPQAMLQKWEVKRLLDTQFWRCSVESHHGYNRYRSIFYYLLLVKSTCPVCGLKIDRCMYATALLATFVRLLQHGFGLLMHVESYDFHSHFQNQVCHVRGVEMLAHTIVPTRVTFRLVLVEQMERGGRFRNATLYWQQNV